MPDPQNPQKSQKSTSQTLTDVEYSTWLTKQQAADAIGVSTKTIEKFAADGKIQQAAWRPQGRGAEKAVYHPDDVARIAAARRSGPQAFVLPAGVTPPVNGNGHHGVNELTITRPPPFTNTEDARRVFVAGLADFAAALRVASESSEKSEKFFLTIPEAAAVSGLSETCLRKLIAGGTLKARKDRGWKIRRTDLEAL